MNYRHAFHVGNFADVMKHATLALVLEHLKTKETPFCMLDTHAGTGRYDLWAEPAQKTGEYREGIMKVLGAPASPWLAPYLAVVRALNKGSTEIRWYPGSPGLALSLMRRQDRLVLCELHPEDARALEQHFAGERRARVYHADGYIALKALLPPKERRGVVLIDPPFEVTDEFARITRGLGHAHRRWATGIYLVWYPIKHRAPVRAFHDALIASGIRRILAAELLLRPDTDPERLNGSGLIVINPPWRLDQALAELLPDLLRRFGATRDGRTRVETLVPE
ncbi:MAG TPA: 23S rRNA (adenine(2030)-N(6))-methyltransferase RlmJ [Alphaproteobacteria bacterium]